jgi:hypothetical protein
LFSSSKNAFNPDGDHVNSFLPGVIPPIPKLKVCSMFGVRGGNILLFVPGVFFSFVSLGGDGHAACE